MENIVIVLSVFCAGFAYLWQWAISRYREEREECNRLVFELHKSKATNDFMYNNNIELWSEVMCAADYLEQAANSINDEDAKKSIIGAAKRARTKCNTINLKY